MFCVQCVFFTEHVFVIIYMQSSKGHTDFIWFFLLKEAFFFSFFFLSYSQSHLFVPMCVECLQYVCHQKYNHEQDRHSPRSPYRLKVRTPEGRDKYTVLTQGDEQYDRMYLLNLSVVILAKLQSGPTPDPLNLESGCQEFGF